MPKVVIRRSATENTVTFHDVSPAEVVNIDGLSVPDRRYIPTEILKRAGFPVKE